MPSIREQILAQSFARLMATPFSGVVATVAWSVTAKNVRRTHLTNVTRDNAPAIHQRDGRDDARSAPTKNNVCAKPRDVEWSIRIFTRDDVNGHLQADAIALEVIDRMRPSFGAGITVEYGEITYDNEIADEDATRMDIAFSADYATPEWRLDVIA